MKEAVDISYYKTLVEGEKKKVFLHFLGILAEYNAKFNLTAITAREEAFEKHFLDSVAAENFFPQNAHVVEVGSGAGFPSLPLKIIRDDLSFTLIESTGKKCSFLRTAIKELNLKNMRVEEGRAEELAKNPLFRERADVVCARAVARLNTLSEYCLPFVKTGGSFIAYKANCEEEVKEANTAIRKLGGKLNACIHYTLPAAGERTLILIDKISKTPACYPRGNGKERKNPL